MNELLTPPSFSLNQTAAPEPQPIGGFLVVVALVLCLGTIQNLSGLVQTIGVVGRIWPRVTDPAAAAYHPYFGSLLVYELVAACFYLTVNIAALVLFFLKRRAFPIFMVAGLPATFILLFVDHYFAGQIPVIAQTATHSRAGYLLAAKFVMLHIWIPYFLVSKRVKTTFVR
jgi:hypothetical protein